MRLSFLLIPTILVLVASCSDSYVMGVKIYKSGQCVREVNKTYASSARSDDKFYRIDSVRGHDYSLSIFYDNQNRWVDIRDRHVTYFKPSRNFDYVVDTCPGKFEVDRGIANKVKKIDVNVQK